MAALLPLNVGQIRRGWDEHLLPVHPQRPRLFDMPAALSASPLVVAHDEDGLPIARDIRNLYVENSGSLTVPRLMPSGHRMSDASTKPGVGHTVEALVDEEGITDPEEEEESSDGSRKSVSHPPGIGLLNNVSSRASTMP